MYKRYIYKLEIKKNAYLESLKFKYSSQFIDRQKYSKNLCIVLAGYKEFLYPAVFGRLKNMYLKIWTFV